MIPMLRAFVLIASLVSTGSIYGLQWQTEVGFSDLASEVGTALETGWGVDAAFVEAPNSAGNYFVDVNNGQFMSKTFVYGSGVSGTSGHANGVGSRFFGNTASLAPGVGIDPNHPVTGFEANDWLNFGLGFATGMDPPTQPYQVSNHSYIAILDSNFTAPMAENLLRRLDFAINQSGMLAVVGTNNGNDTTPLPALWVQGYNSISVGVTDGGHASSVIRGGTTLYGSGRIKPEIVAPSTYTSTSTPMVSSAAALLHEAGAGSDAVQSETLKALLLAGATKDEFSSWSRSPSQPLDLRFGAGELNIYHSYFMLQSGETNGTTGVPSAAMGESGWDYEPAIEAGGDRYYEFVVAENTLVAELSLVLTWNMEIIDINSGSQFSPVESLADMNLQFYNSTQGFLNELVDSSVSAIDNIEHIYLKHLTPGTYHLRVTSDLEFDYGLAWRSSVIAAPVVGGFGAKFLDGQIAAGQLPDTYQSNDQYLELEPSPTSNPGKQIVDMILLAETSIEDPSYLGFRVEAAMLGGPVGDVVQTLELWDEAGRRWELMDSRAAENSDTVVQVSAEGDLSRFIHPLTGELIARVTWTSPEFTGSPFLWSMDLDQAVWQIAD